MKRSPMPRSTKPMSRTRKRTKVHPRPAPEPVCMPGKVDRRYLDWVADQGCCFHFLGGCFGDVVAHHYPQGAGFRDDALSCGACVGHHGTWHDNQCMPATESMGIGLSHVQCVALFRECQLKLLTEWRDAG